LHLAPVPSESSGEPARSRVRVVLADDHVLIRHSLRMLFEGEEDVELIADASELSAAISRVRQHRPDVLVLDLRMPGGSSIEAIRQLRSQVPQTRVVVVTMERDPLFAERSREAGALGFVFKDYADDELPQAVRAAARGEPYVSPRVGACASGMRPAHPPSSSAAG
jgi:two-component system response regulator NreC